MAVKNKSLKKSLSEQAEENTSVTRGKRGDQTSLKSGLPNDNAARHFKGYPVVGVSIGMTLNMDNYESLRVDTWLTDAVHEGETVEEAYDRVTKVVDDTLGRIASQYKED